MNTDIENFLNEYTLATLNHQGNKLPESLSTKHGLYQQSQQLSSQGVVTAAVKINGEVVIRRFAVHV